MGRTRTKWSFSSAAAICLIASAAHADPTEADVEGAKAAYAQGVDLREQKDLKGALAHFRAAYALVPTPITGLEVGRALIDLGKVSEGRALLLEVAQMPKSPTESEKAQQARDEAVGLAERSKAQLATLTLDASLRPESTVTVDDQPIPREAALAPRPLDPGHHVVVVRTGDKTARAEVDLAPGQQQTLHVGVEAPRQAQSKLVFRPGAPFYVSVTVAGAGLLAGAVTGVAAVATAGSLSSHCPAHLCPPSESGTLNASLALGWTSTIGFIVLGAGAVSSIITFALSGKRESKVALRITPGLGILSLSGAF